MEFVFGSVLVCSDIDTASKVAYDPKVSRKCVTLEGDVVDPQGTLSGGNISTFSIATKHLEGICIGNMGC